MASPIPLAVLDMWGDRPGWRVQGHRILLRGARLRLALNPMSFTRGRFERLCDRHLRGLGDSRA